MAEFAYVGKSSYELIYKNDPNLTVAQATALAAEYTKLGVRWKRCVWNGFNCVIAKATTAESDRFCQRRGAEWESIRTRVGYHGLTIALNNRYRPGVTEPNLGPEWNSVVAFIEANYNRKWWEFWK